MFIQVWFQAQRKGQKDSTVQGGSLIPHVTPTLETFHSPMPVLILLPMPGTACMVFQHGSKLMLQECTLIKFKWPITKGLSGC